jgi:hypothetical protein
LASATRTPANATEREAGEDLPDCGADILLGIDSREVALRQPRNASGKLDRRALPVPTLEATSAGGYEAPATPAEEAVAYVWRDVLGVPRVGRQDDFYALGGRSLLLPRVRHRLEQELGVRLSLASLLERTTAAALALAAEELLLDELERELAAAR